MLQQNQNKIKKFSNLFFTLIALVAMYSLFGVSNANAACSANETAYCNTFPKSNATTRCVDDTSNNTFSCFIEQNNSCGNVNQIVSSVKLQGQSQNGSAGCTNIQDNGKNICQCVGTFNTSLVTNGVTTTTPTTGGQGGAVTATPTKVAATTTTTVKPSGSSSNSGKVIDSPTPGITSFGDLLSRFFGLVPLGLGLLLLGYFIYGAITILTAGADDQKKAQGFKIMTNAAIGLVLGVASVSAVIYLQALLSQSNLFNI